MNKYSNLWSMPNVAKATMTRKELKQFLLDHNGEIIAQGRLRKIYSKHIGAGVYTVWTEEVNRHKEAP